jgi:hypothetical protein
MELTAKEKARELVELYCQLLSIRYYENKEKAKQCALIAVDELILTLQCGIICIDVERKSHLDLINYWQQVKKEINNL